MWQKSWGILSYGREVSEEQNMTKRADRDLLLVNAAQRGDTALVEELLKEGADPNTTSGAASPLVFAAEENHIDMVRLLLQAGANIN